MTTPEFGLLDTSIFIANETVRGLDESKLPDHVAISVVTLAELHVGVLAARDTATRARRLETLNTTTDIEVLDIDESVAVTWARLRGGLAETGRRINVNDLWIAATALANDLPVVTQDSDYQPLEDMQEISVIRA